jgi:hypothetical protein
MGEKEGEWIVSVAEAYPVYTFMFGVIYKVVQI